MSLDLTWNRETGEVTPAVTFTLKRGVTKAVRLFLAAVGDWPATITAPAEIRLTARQKGNAAVALLKVLTVADYNTELKCFPFDLLVASDVIDTLLAIGTDGELDSASILIELAYRPDGGADANWTKSKNFSLTVQDDLTRLSDAPPSTALTRTQQIAFLAAIGLVYDATKGGWTVPLSATDGDDAFIPALQVPA